MKDLSLRKRGFRLFLLSFFVVFFVVLYRHSPVSTYVSAFTEALGSMRQMKQEAMEFENQLAESPTALQQLVAKDPQGTISKTLKLLLHKCTAFTVLQTVDTPLRAKTEAECRLAYSHARQAYLLVPKSVGDKTNYFLEHLSTYALLLGEIENAEEYANELLHSRKEDHFYWDSIHTAHTVLGRIALRKDDITAARKHLVQAGAVESSPFLAIVGPKFALAQELLERGEKAAVVDYLIACKEFWNEGSDQLEQWVQMIENGSKPVMNKVEL